MQSTVERSGLIVVLLTVAAAVLRLPNLGESLWYDEVHYSTGYAAGSLSEVWSLFLHDGAAPLYRVLLFFWVRVFGDAELVVRTPSWLFGIASIGLTYRIARTYGAPWVALLAASFLCVSPVHVWYSQEATPYAMTLLLLLTSVLAWFRLRADPTSPGWSVIYCGGLLATVFTHYFAALFLFPLTLASLTLEGSSRWRVLAVHAVVASCLAVALGIKYHLGDVQSGMAFLRPFTPFEWWMLFFHWFLQGNALWTVGPYRATVTYLLSEPIFVACQAFFCLLFVRGLFSYRAQPRAAWELLVLTVAVPSAMVLLTRAGYRQLYIERYLLVLLPFVVIVLARGAASFANRKAVLACSAALGAIGVASYGAWLHKSEAWTVYKQNPDWRAAARYLGHQAVPSGGAVILVTMVPAELEHYLPRERNAPGLRVVVYDRSVVESLLDGHAQAFHLVKNNDWASGVDEVVRQFKDERRLALTTTRSFKGLEIYTFLPRTRASSATPRARTGFRLTAMHRCSTVFRVSALDDRLPTDPSSTIERAGDARLRRDPRAIDQ